MFFRLQVQVQVTGAQRRSPVTGPPTLFVRSVLVRAVSVRSVAQVHHQPFGPNSERDWTGLTSTIPIGKPLWVEHDELKSLHCVKVCVFVGVCLNTLFTYSYIVQFIYCTTIS